jgi:hypothetical protein
MRVGFSTKSFKADQQVAMLTRPHPTANSTECRHLQSKGKSTVGITRSRAMERTDRNVEGQTALSCVRSGSLTRISDSID